MPIQNGSIQQCSGASATLSLPLFPDGTARGLSQRQRRGYEMSPLATTRSWHMDEERGEDIIASERVLLLQ